MKLQKGRFLDWAAVFAYVAFIYSTLCLTPPAARFFARLLGRNFSLVVDLLILAAVFGLPFVLYKRLRLKGPGAWLALAAVIYLYILMLGRWTEITAEKTHLIEYGFLSFLLVRALRDVRPRVKMYLLVVLGVAVIGYCDELIQWALPGRVYDPKDIALNAISGILGLIMVEILR